MSKYNLIDIMEEYKIGSGWTKDFDYYGMLRAGLAIKDDTSLEVMKDIVEDFTDVNYHREAAHLYDAIEAIEANDGDYDAGEDKIEDFQQEIMMTIKSQGMDDKGDDFWGKDLGSFMKKRMGENKESVEVSEDFDSVVDDIMDQGKSRKDAEKIAGAINAKYVGNYRQEESLEEGVVKKIRQALKDDAKGTDVEIDSYMDSLRKSGDSFDDIDDFVEDFKNYVADRGLQEHFGRFLKDFQ